MYSCNGYGPYLDACPPIIYQSYEWIVNNAMGWDHIKQWYERERETLAVGVIGTDEWITVQLNCKFSQNKENYWIIHHF